MHGAILTVYEGSSGHKSAKLQLPGDITRREDNTAVKPGVFVRVPYSEGVAVVDDDDDGDESDPKTAHILVMDVDSNAGTFTGTWVWERDELDGAGLRQLGQHYDCILTTDESGPFAVSAAVVATPPLLAPHVMDIDTKKRTKLDHSVLADVAVTVAWLCTCPVHTDVFTGPGHVAQYASRYRKASATTQRAMLQVANALYSGAPTEKGKLWFCDPDRIVKEIARLDGC